MGSGHWGWDGAVESSVKVMVNGPTSSLLLVANIFGLAPGAPVRGNRSARTRAGRVPVVLGSPVHSRIWNSLFPEISENFQEKIGSGAEFERNLVAN